MPTLLQALHTYLQEDRRPSTNKQYRLILTALVREIGPGRDVQRVSYEDLLDYFAQLRADGRAPATIRSYSQITRAFFNWCVQRGYIKSPPTAGLHFRLPPRDPTRRRDIPGDELARMVEYARVTSPRNYALLLFLADTGCRAGGAASLQVDHLDLEQHVAVIQEKGGHWVKVRFGSTTAVAVGRWLDLRPAAAHGYVWTGKAPAYNPLKPASISAVIAAIAEAVGASQSWRAHAIRHAVGHALANEGVPVSVVQRKLNHADPLITARFYFPDSDRDLEMVSERLALAPLRKWRKDGTG